MSRKNGGYIGYLSADTVDKEGASGVYDISDQLDYSTSVPFNQLGEQFGAAVWPQTDTTEGDDPYLGDVVGGIYSPHIENTIFTEASGNWDEVFDPKTGHQNRLPTPTFLHQTNRYWALKFSTHRRNAIAITNKPEFNFGEGNFTIEFWYKPNTRGDGLSTSPHFYNKTILSYGESVSSVTRGWEICRRYTYGNQVFFTDLTTYYPFHETLTSTLWSSFEWVHYCFVRENGILKLYENGVLTKSVASTSNVTPTGTVTLKVGTNYASNTSHSTHGLLTDLRISNTVERTGLTFAVPSLPITATPNTVLLLASDTLCYHTGSNVGNDQNIVITDLNAHHQRWPDVPYNYKEPAKETAYGFNFPELYNTQSHLQYLRANLYPLLNDTSFTLETWFMSTTIRERNAIVPLVVISSDEDSYSFETTYNRGKTIGLYYNYRSTGPAAIVPNAYNTKDILMGYLAGGNVLVKPGYPSLGNATPYLETGEWHHMALTFDKDSGNIAVYVDGTYRDGTNVIGADMSRVDQKIFIGINPQNITRHNGDYYYKGCMQDITITKNVKYTANFTPTTSAIPLDNNILFKTLHDNTSSFRYFTPSGNVEFTVNNISSATINRITYEIGESRSRELGPVYFDDKYIPNFIEEEGVKKYERLASLHNRSDYGVVYPDLSPNNKSLDFETGPFTAEAWVYVVGGDGDQGIIGKGTATTGWGLSVVNNQLVFEHNNITITGSDPRVEYGSWCHIVAQRSGTGANLFHMFVNGRLASVDTVTSNLTTTSRNLYVLNKRNPETTNKNFIGLINNLRLSNVARYPVPVTNTIGTVAFTPSMGPYNNDANTVFLGYQYMWSDAESGGKIDLGSQMNPITHNSVPYLRGAPPATHRNWSYVTRDGSTGLKLYGVSWNDGTLTGGSPLTSDDFSIEFFLQPHNRLVGTTETRYIIDGRWNGEGPSADVTSLDTGGLYIRQNPYGYIEVGYNYDAGQFDAVALVSRTAIAQLPVWHHICVQRVDNNWALYINGVKEAEHYSNRSTSSPYTWTIWESGTLGSRTGQGWYGYFYGLRICRRSTAYGTASRSNPERIPVPKEPLTNIPGCTFLGFDKPFFADVTTSLNGNDANTGSFVPVKVHRDQTVNTGRWEYAPSQYTPFKPGLLDWKNTYFSFVNSITTTYTIESALKDGGGIGDNFSYNSLFHKTFTMEGWHWLVQFNSQNVIQGNFRSQGTTVFSTLNTNTANSALGGGILYTTHFYDGDGYGGAEAFGRVALKWHHIRTTNPGFTQRSFFYSNDWVTNPGHNYSHFIIQHDADSHRLTIWVNGIRIMDTTGNYGADGLYVIENYILDGAIKSLEYLSGLDALNVEFRAKYPFSLRRIPVEKWNKPPKINKFTALRDTTNAAVIPVGFSSTYMRPQGYPKISRGVRNLGRPTIYLNQNSVTGAGGVWTSTTPPWGAQTNTAYQFTVGDANDYRLLGPSYNDFTIEGWFAWAGAASPNDKYLWELSDNIGLRTVSGAYSLRFNNVDTQSYTSSANVSGNSSNIVFDHLVVQRNGSVLTLYVNGVEHLSIPIGNNATKYSPIAPATEYNLNLNYNNASIWVGSDSERTGSKSWLGYFSDFRITRLARYETALVNGVNTMVHRGTIRPALPTAPFKVPITEIK